MNILCIERKVVSFTGGFGSMKLVSIVKDLGFFRSYMKVNYIHSLRELTNFVVRC